MKKNRKIIIIICIVIAIVIAILAVTKRKKSYQSLIKEVDWENTDGYYQYNDKDISTDEETGETYVNNIINIIFDKDCSEKKMADVINSVHGKVVGGNLNNKDLYIQIKKSTLEELQETCDKLNNVEGVDASIDFYGEDGIFEDPGEYFEGEEYDDESLEE